MLTDSAFAAKELALHARVPESKLRVVHLGSEHILGSSADPSILDRLGLSGRSYVLTVSSRSPHKNLDALAAAAQRMPHVPFVAAGGANPRVFQSVDRLAGTMLETGYLPDSQLRALYESAACFVYPSSYEGFGLPAVEAMACGCPVVASRSASLPEVCGEAAEYCDGSDPASITRAVRRVLEIDDLRRGLIARGSERACRFTWEKAADGLLAAMREASELWAG